MSAGRKTLSKSGELMKPRAVRMLDAEWEKCLSLGGSAWIRQRIKRAKTGESSRTTPKK
jgi:hypothetical protein